MPFIVILFLVLEVYAEDFISPMEYAKMLYQNPRGVGCNKCHGDRGEGRIISKYYEINRQTNKKEKKQLVIAPINNISEEKFIEALKKGRGVMPTYFLTKYEAQILYLYISKQSEQQ